MTEIPVEVLELDFVEELNLSENQVKAIPEHIIKLNLCVFNFSVASFLIKNRRENGEETDFPAVAGTIFDRIIPRYQR